KQMLQWGLRNNHRTNSRQKIRKVLGRALIIVVIAIPVAFMVLFWSAFLPHEIKTGEHLDSVDWLPPSATDVSFTKRGGFGWIKNYECLIPEDDFFLLFSEEIAHKKFWQRLFSQLPSRPPVLLYWPIYRNANASRE
ncbi:MAG: hypothetical protein PVG96_03220, partial [Desulfobacterales bacterium]